MIAAPDWKLHFSIAPRGDDDMAWDRDIGAGYDILAALFMERCCEIGMKARYSRWADMGQRGRELTVYIYTFTDEFDVGHPGGPMDGCSPPGEEHKHYLGREYEAYYTPRFWFQFITEAERRLAAAGLRSAGLANGDLPLPGCRYCSLRNEAYVFVENPDWAEGMRDELRQQLEYPPNATGWNARGHPNIFEDCIQLLRDNHGKEVPKDAPAGSPVLTTGDTAFERRGCC